MAQRGSVLPFVTMKTNKISLRSFLTTAALAAVVFATSSTAVRASDLDRPISRELAATGEVAVANAGPYVEVGSYRIWVSSHLGRPSAVLTDGTWLYSNYSVNDTAVAGTLAVTFTGGRVAAMKLLSPTRVAILRSAPKAGNTLVAAK